MTPDKDKYQTSVGGLHFQKFPHSHGFNVRILLKFLLF